MIDKEKEEKIAVLISALEDIRDGGDDHEQNHIDADNLLLEFIDDSRVDSAFNSIRKWYA